MYKKILIHSVKQNYNLPIIRKYNVSIVSKYANEKEIYMIVFDNAYFKNEIKCIGGSAFGDTQYYPSQIVCINDGIDENGKVKWKCGSPFLSKNVKITSYNVSFEKFVPPFNEYTKNEKSIFKYELNYNDNDDGNNPIKIHANIMSCDTQCNCIYSKMKIE
jgi:hypothetical protein